MLLVLLVGDVGVRTEIIPATADRQVQPELGGLTPDQGDPTAIIAKAPTEAATAAPGFLGLPPATLLALQIGLAVLVCCCWPEPGSSAGRRSLVLLGPVCCEATVPVRRCDVARRGSVE